MMGLSKGGVRSQEMYDVNMCSSATVNYRGLISQTVKKRMHDNPCPLNVRSIIHTGLSLWMAIAYTLYAVFAEKKTTNNFVSMQIIRLD
jgi:hypothetical protein